jgi:DUF1009 family protein
VRIATLAAGKDSTGALWEITSLMANTHYGPIANLAAANLIPIETMAVSFARQGQTRLSTTAFHADCEAVRAVLADCGLDRCGVALMDSTAPIPDQMAHAGLMTRRGTTPEQKADINFVWPLLTQTLRLDIGQSIAVRERDVIAVEAVEGTDRMIERVGQICRSKSWTLCKGARAGHDRRSDVPTVGVKTLENLHAAGGRCLALAAGDVIMLDKAKMIDLAEELGVVIVGIPTGQV